MHVSLQLGYQIKCDIETVLLSEDLNVVDGVDKYQCVELLKIIGCKQENNACHGSLPALPAQTKDHDLIAVYEPACGQFLLIFFVDIFVGGFFLDFHN